MSTSFQLPTVSEATEFPLVPEGLYLFRLKAMEEAGLGKSFDDKPPKERVKWIFDIEEVISGDDESEDFLGEEFWAWTTLSMNTRATMYKWASALLGRDIDEGENVNASDLIGKRARANIEHYDKLSGDKGHRIASLMRVPSRKKTAKTAPAPAEDDDDFDEF